MTLLHVSCVHQAFVTSFCYILPSSWRFPQRCHFDVGKDVPSEVNGWPSFCGELNYWNIVVCVICSPSIFGDVNEPRCQHLAAACYCTVYRYPFFYDKMHAWLYPLFFYLVMFCQPENERKKGECSPPKRTPFFVLGKPLPESQRGSRAHEWHDNDPQPSWWFWREIYLILIT